MVNSSTDGSTTATDIDSLDTHALTIYLLFFFAVEDKHGPRHLQVQVGRAAVYADELIGDLEKPS